MAAGQLTIFLTRRASHSPPGPTCRTERGRANPPSKSSRRRDPLYPRASTNRLHRPRLLRPPSSPICGIATCAARWIRRCSDTGALRIGQRFSIFFGGQMGKHKISDGGTSGSAVAFFFTHGPAAIHAAHVPSRSITSSSAGFTITSAADFARYCSDERWLILHFEKMLNDNAMLLDTDNQRLAGSIAMPCAVHASRRPWRCCFAT